MRDEIVSRLCVAMDEAGLDLLVAVSPENFTYVTGFMVPSQPLMRWRHAMAIITKQGLEKLLVVDMEESTVRSKDPDAEIHVWGEFTDQPMSVLAKLIDKMGFKEGNIGLEMAYLPASDFEQLKGLLPKACFTPATSLYDGLRMRKTEEEIKLLRNLSKITDQAIGEAFHSVSAGMTEMDLAGSLLKSLYSLGAEGFKLMIVATGERSEYPNVGPTHRVLKRGDLCRVEIFGMIGGYYAAACRTAVVQEASPEAERIWRNLIECKYLVLDMIRPGESTKAIYEAFLKKFSELGLPPISFVGHGIGLHLHEDPYLGKYTDDVLEQGMVLGIEPLVYGTGKGFGLQSKDTVLVNSKGCEVLTDQTANDRLIVIP